MPAKTTTFEDEYEKVASEVEAFVREQERASRSERRVKTEESRESRQREQLDFRRQQAAAQAQQREQARADRAAAQARRNAEAENRRLAQVAAQQPDVRAPNLSLAPRGGGALDQLTTGSLDRATATRSIVILTVLAVIGEIAVNALHTTPGAGTYKLKSGATIKVPQNLRGIAGVLLANIVALIVAEVQPLLGLTMSGLVAADVGYSFFTGNASVAANLGGGLFKPGSVIPPGNLAGLPNNPRPNAAQPQGPGTALGPGQKANY
jgi:hypothetical protein